MPYSYHNSSNVTGQQLTDYENKAQSQEQRILRWAKDWPDFSFTPTACLKHVFQNSIPITSVRRALTNLTNAGDLVKTDKQARGPYGRPEHQWKLPPGQQRLF